MIMSTILMKDKDNIVSARIENIMQVAINKWVLKTSLIEFLFKSESCTSFWIWIFIINMIMMIVVMMMVSRIALYKPMVVVTSEVVMSNQYDYQNKTYYPEQDVRWRHQVR